MADMNATWQWSDWPERQAAHRPHVGAMATTTRSPSEKSRTPEPIALTVPTHSWPQIAGW